MEAPLGVTALHFAASGGKAEVAKRLLESGADVDARDADGDTPLHWALHWTGLRHVEVIKILLEGGASLKGGSEDDQPMIFYAARNETPEIMKLIIEAGADVNARHKGDMPLIHATNIEIMKVLLVAGADVTAKGETGRTPLHLFARSWNEHQPEVLKLLLESGADVDARDGDGCTPLHTAPGETIHANTKLVEVVKTLLSGGANPNARAKNGETPLHFLAKSELQHPLHQGWLQNKRLRKKIAKIHEESVEALIAAGANVNLQNTSGQKPIDVLSDTVKGTKGHRLIKGATFN